MPPGLAEALLAHAWPGNVRELKSAAERHALGLPVLPATNAASPAGRSLQATLDALEGLLLEEALRRCKGRVDAVCEELDLSPATFYRKVKAHGLKTS
jgi:two-component system C4-dicarboxylate transport response regulator DctD